MLSSHRFKYKIHKLRAALVCNIFDKILIKITIYNAVPQVNTRNVTTIDPGIVDSVYSTIYTAVPPVNTRNIFMLHPLTAATADSVYFLTESFLGFTSHDVIPKQILTKAQTVLNCIFKHFL